MIILGNDQCRGMTAIITVNVSGFCGVSLNI